MFTRADIKPLSIAAATAVCAGLGLGAWATPPARSHVPAAVEIQPIYGDDPNLALYKQVIAEQGGPGPLYIVTGYPSLAPSGPPGPDGEAEMEARIKREAAAFEAETRAWEAERSARLQAVRAPWSGPVLPAAYGQPEQVTTSDTSEDADAYPLPSPG